MWQSLLNRFKRRGRAEPAAPGTYVMTITFGPVQGFIASARRTRDLWFGSYILSEVSKAAARKLRDAASGDQPLATEVKLIFPHSEQPNKDFRVGSKFNVANKLMAVVITDDPAKLASTVKEAAIGHFVRIADHCLKKFGAGNVDEKRWNEQKQDVVECYAAWAPLNRSDYPASLRRANALLDARKALRDFQPAALTARDECGFGIPKSSLDGARESVLKSKKDDGWNSALEAQMKAARERFDIDEHEHLDCPGVIKRVLGKRIAFAAVTRVAAQPWVDYLCKKHDREFRAIEAAYGELFQLRLATRAKSYDRLKYDAQFVYLDRLQAQLRRADTEPEPLKKLQQLLDDIKKKSKEPIPYVVVLQADGDRMGALIQGLGSLEAHRKLAKALAAYAADVPLIVQGHGGQCVYAGGEDILALLPTDGAIACAEELAWRFAKQLGEVDAVKQWVAKSTDNRPPSLSVGLGIGHIMTPMNVLRELAQAAERLAKEGKPDDEEPKKRNALGIVIQPRSGAPLEHRDNWGDWNSPHAFPKRLRIWIDAFQNGTLPDRLVYQLGELMRPVPREQVYGEMKRLIKRKNVNEDKDTGEEVLACLNECLHRVPLPSPGLRAHCIDNPDLIQEWLVARWFAKHTYAEPGMLEPAEAAHAE